MKAGCTSVCPRKCCTKLTEEQRRNIYETFWTLDRKNRNKWVSKLLMQEPIERRTNADKQSRRLRSLYYHLPTSSDCTTDNVRVCKRFFLATIGHSYSQIIGQITNSPEFRDQFMPPLPFEKRSWSRYKKKDGGINEKNSFNNSIPQENHEVTTHLLENSPTLPIIPTACEAVDDVEQETLFKSEHSSATDHVSSDPISTQVPIDKKAKIDDSWSNPPSDSADEEDEDVMDEEPTDVEHVPPEGLYHSRVWSLYFDQLAAWQMSTHSDSCHVCPMTDDCHLGVSCQQTPACGEQASRVQVVGISDKIADNRHRNPVVHCITAYQLINVDV